MSLDESFKQLVFMVCQVEDYQNILKLSCRPLAFISYKVFLNNKRSGASLPASFSTWLFEGKYFSSYILLPDFFVWLPLLREILRNICNCLLTRQTNFEINLIFLIKSGFLAWPKFNTKIKISWEQEEFLRWNKKHISSFLKGFHWNK